MIADYALEPKDLDMALYYVLDQVSLLEFFTIELLKYFETTAKG